MQNALTLSLVSPVQPRSIAPPAGPTNTVSPQISGTPQIGQTLTISDGAWSANGTVSFGYSWLRNGAVIANATANTYVLQNADDQAGISAFVTATDIDGTTMANSQSVGISYVAPGFTIQPSIAPGSAQVGASFTVSLGQADPAATISIDYFTLDDVDKSAELSGLVWDSSGATPGTLATRATATNSGGSAVSAVAIATLNIATAVPDMFVPTDWTLVDKTVGGTLQVTFTNTPFDGNSPILDIEYQVDGGLWVSSGMNVPGSFDITGLIDGQSYTVALRAINAVGAGVASVTKPATPGASASVPAQIAVGDWSVIDAASGGILDITLTTEPGNGGAAITAIEYQLDGGNWIDSGQTATGQFSVTGLNDGQSYAVALRASNQVGAAVPSVTKTATPTGQATEIARFGTWNGTTNPAPYDTKGAAIDGVFGEFSVTGGVIAPNVQPLSAGSFSVGGYPVDVDAAIKSVSSQAEFDNAVANIGDLDGKTLVVRWGAEIANAASWYHKAIRRTVANCIFEGDGAPLWEKTQFHFGNITFDNTSKIAFRNLAFRSVTLKSDHTYGPMQHAVFEDNHFGDADPDPNGNYSAVAYTGNDCFAVQNSGIHGLRVVGNTFRGGGGYAHILFWYEEWGELVGNHFDKYYADAMKIRGADPIVVAANIATRPFSLSSDAGNPHSDSIQIEQTTGQSTDVYEANFFVRGNCRGKVSANLYIAGGPGFDGAAEGNGSVTNGFFGNRAVPTSGLQFNYNGALPPPGFTGTVGDYRRNSIDTDLGGGTSLQNSFGGTVVAPATVSTSGNVELQYWDAATLALALPNWANMIMDRPSYHDALNAFVPAIGGALDGRGPGAAVTLAPNAKAISFQMPSLRAAPFLSGISVSAQTTSFSASVTSDTAKRPVFWAVVPNGTLINSWRDIKERTIVGAVDYGFASSPAAGLININGGAGTLTGATAFDLVMFQENGWTTRSAVTTQSFVTI